MPNGYTKPMVSEAILDLRVTLAPGTGFNILEGIANSLKHRFPRQEAIFTDTLQFGFYQGQVLPPEATRTQNGFRLISQDGLKVLQVSIEGFTFSRLQPYTGWNEFSAEARELWEIYKAACIPQEIKRIGLRYINLINFPAEKRLSSFLALRPLLPENLPSRDMLGFFMQVQLAQQDLESMLIVNQARITPPDEDTISVILDLDLFRDGSWSMEQEKTIWELLGQFRVRKNEVFEASIEQETRRLME